MKKKPVEYWADTPRSAQMAKVGSANYCDLRTQNLSTKGSSLVLSAESSRATTRLRNTHRSRTKYPPHIV